MVVLTIGTQKNGETIFLDKLIPQVHFVELISCSLYNYWDTLKKESIAILGDEKSTLPVNASPEKEKKIPPGYYNLENLAKLINDLFSIHNYNQLEAQINTPEAVLQLKNFGVKAITFNRNFADIFGIDDLLKLITNVKRPRYPTSSFIYCNLIDRNYNFFNNKRSDLLAKIDVRGKAMMMLLPKSLFETARQVLM